MVICYYRNRIVGNYFNNIKFYKLKQEQMKIFLSLMVVYCMGMALYYFVSEETHQLIFWSMLTLFNYQSLIKIIQNKDE